MNPEIQRLVSVAYLDAGDRRNGFLTYFERLDLSVHVFPGIERFR